MGETGLIFSEQHFIPLTSLLSSVTEWKDCGLLASWTLRSCVTLGPASVFLFVNGGHNIHLAELKGSEITQEAPSTALGSGSPIRGSHSFHLKLPEKVLGKPVRRRWWTVNGQNGWEQRDVSGDAAGIFSITVPWSWLLPRFLPLVGGAGAGGGADCRGAKDLSALFFLSPFF